jgi:hypothetical protein
LQKSNPNFVWQCFYHCDRQAHCHYLAVLTKRIFAVGQRKITAAPTASSERTRDILVWSGKLCSHRSLKTEMGVEAQSHHLLMLKCSELPRIRTAKRCNCQCKENIRRDPSGNCSGAQNCPVQ